MANVYVYSGAGGAGTGADWTNAYTTLAAACTAKAAGDVFYVAHDHAEAPGAAITITSPGSDSTPCRVYCVDRAGTVPPVSADLRTTATISTNAAANLLLAGSISELYGISFSTGNATSSTATIGIGNTTQRSIRMVNCHLKLNNSGAASRIQCCNNSNATTCILENTTVEFGSLSQSISSLGRTIWRNTPNAIVGATVPTGVFSFNTGGTWFVEGVDLSAAGSGKTIFQVNAVPNPVGILKDCKLGASVTIAANAASNGGLEATVIRSDSDDTNYRIEKYAFAGTQTTETVIVREGGASDYTTPISWKVVSTTTCKPEVPFECLPISIWNETVGSPITVEVYAIKASGLPTNADIWIDVQYLGTSGSPIASKATSGKVDGLATPTTYSSDDSIWGGSLTSPGVFGMEVTITPEEKGPITVYPRVGVASTTFYIDPKVFIE